MVSITCCMRASECVLLSQGPASESQCWTVDRLVWCFNTVWYAAACENFQLEHVGCDSLLKAFFVIALWNAPLFDAGEIRPNPAMLAGGGNTYGFAAITEDCLSVRVCRVRCAVSASSFHTIYGAWHKNEKNAHYWVQLTDLKHALWCVLYVDGSRVKYKTKMYMTWKIVLMIHAVLSGPRIWLAERRVIF